LLANPPIQWNVVGGLLFDHDKQNQKDN